MDPKPAVEEPKQDSLSEQFTELERLFKIFDERLEDLLAETGLSINEALSAGAAHLALRMKLKEFKVDLEERQRKVHRLVSFVNKFRYGTAEKGPFTNAYPWPMDSVTLEKIAKEALHFAAAFDPPGVVVEHDQYDDS